VAAKGFAHASGGAARDLREASDVSSRGGTARARTRFGAKRLRALLDDLTGALGGVPMDARPSQALAWPPVSRREDGPSANEDVERGGAT
jgi:hypothetical protein